jgi:hypothetical protein
MVISLISWGCPTQAIVHTYDLDERTVAEWQRRAGLHCEKVHQDEKVEVSLCAERVQKTPLGNGVSMSGPDGGFGVTSVLPPILHGRDKSRPYLSRNKLRKRRGRDAVSAMRSTLSHPTMTGKRCMSCMHLLHKKWQFIAIHVGTRFITSAGVQTPSPEKLTLTPPTPIDFEIGRTYGTLGRPRRRTMFMLQRTLLY